MTLERKARAIQAIAAALLDAAQDLVDALTVPVTPGHRLSVPWIGQNTSRTDDDYSNSDCGAAVVAMIVGGFSVDEVSKSTGKLPGYKSLSFDDLIIAAATFGLHLQHVSLTLAEICSEIDRDHPVIVLVNYKSLPVPNRFDMGYNGGHYLLIVGYDETYITYHDPYQSDAEHGAYEQLTRGEFLTAYTTVAPGNQYASHALRILS